MAQGEIKKKVSKSNKVQKPQRRHNAPQPKRITKVSDKVRKKYFADLTAKTEQLLGDRAGHLELLGKNRKDRNKKKAGEEAKSRQGGSRKFG